MNIAVEVELLAAADVAQELGLTFDDSFLACGDVLLGVVADAEDDVFEELRKPVDEGLGAVLTRPQVDVHLRTIVGVHAFDMKEYDLRAVYGDDLGSELDICDSELLEVHLAVVINVTGLV